MAMPALPRNPVGALPPAVPEEARPFLQALLNASGWAVGFLDRELRLQWANDAMVALTGQPLSFQVGRPLGELWPALAPGLSPLCARALSGEAITGAALSGALGMMAAEEVRHLRVSLLPAVAGGALAGLTLTVQDETERVREEEAVRESEARLKALMDLSCDGYIVHDGREVLEVSRGCASLLGCFPEEMVGRPLTQFLAPEARTDAMEILRKEVDTPYELLALRRSGQRIPLQLLEREVTFSGQPARLAAMWDISGRKTAEEAAERAEYLREQLLGVVGHELRTPLNALLLGLSAFQRAGRLDASQVRQISHMTSSAQRMERMIRELLDFTHARLTGAVPVLPAPMSLEGVLEWAVADLEMLYPERTILRVIEGDLRGHWDETRLGQLLDNLLQNALRHGARDTPVELSVRGDREGISLAVLNKGNPLKFEEREAIFEPFRRGTKAAGEGLGLGLYIARHIAEAHGGRISVESSAERGTTFKVWLPRRAPDTH
jgi:PAS domain S-box-containing protein